MDPPTAATPTPKPATTTMYIEDRPPQFVWGWTPADASRRLVDIEGSLSSFVHQYMTGNTAAATAGGGRAFMIKTEISVINYEQVGGDTLEAVGGGTLKREREEDRVHETEREAKRKPVSMPPPGPTSTPSPSLPRDKPSAEAPIQITIPPMTVLPYNKGASPKTSATLNKHISMVNTLSRRFNTLFSQGELPPLRPASASFRINCDGKLFS